MPDPEQRRGTTAGELRSGMAARLEAARAAGLPPGFELRSTRTRLLTVLGALAIGPLAGTAIARIVAPGSPFASFIGFITLPLVLGGGYAVWRAVIASLLVRGVSRSLFRGIYQIFVRRTKLSADDVLPDADQIATFLHQCVLAAGAFARVGLTIGLAAGLLLAVASPGARSSTTSRTCVAWASPCCSRHTIPTMRAGLQTGSSG
jgi:hypothetical protein